MARVVLALVAGGQDRLGEARAFAAEAAETGQTLGLASTVAMAGWARGQAELAAGRYLESIATLEAAGRLMQDRGMEAPAIVPWAQDLAEAYIRAGQPAEALATVQLLERQAARSGERLAAAGAARTRGLLADESEFEGYFQTALSWHRAVTNPFERARTELCFGERLRRARRRRDARPPLQRSLDAFERIGATVWAERSARELRATGLRVRRREASVRDKLTSQELCVAQLVAEGRSNRDIAAMLFISPRTVESHLNSAYRKLGLSSRTQLTRVVSAE